MGASGVARWEAGCVGWLASQGSMGKIEIERFIEDLQEGLRDAGNFRKADWRAIAEYYNVEVRRKARKAEVRETVMGFLSNSGLIEEDAPR